MEIPRDGSPELASQAEIEVTYSGAASVLARLDIVRNQMAREVVGEEIYIRKESEAISEGMQEDVPPFYLVEEDPDIAEAERNSRIAYIDELIDKDALGKRLSKRIGQAEISLLGAEASIYLQTLLLKYDAIDPDEMTESEKLGLGGLLMYIDSFSQGYEGGKAWKQALEGVVDPKITEAFGEMYGKRATRFVIDYHPLTPEAEALGHTKPSANFGVEFRDNRFAERTLGKLVAGMQLVLLSGENQGYRHERFLPIIGIPLRRLRDNMYFKRVEMIQKNTDGIGLYLHDGRLLRDGMPLESRQDIDRAQDTIRLTQSVIDKLAAGLRPEHRELV